MLGLIDDAPKVFSFKTVGTSVVHYASEEYEAIKVIITRGSFWTRNVLDNKKGVGYFWFIYQ